MKIKMRTRTLEQRQKQLSPTTRLGDAACHGPDAKWVDLLPLMTRRKRTTMTRTSQRLWKRIAMLRVLWWKRQHQLEHQEEGPSEESRPRQMSSPSMPMEVDTKFPIGDDITLPNHGEKKVMMEDFKLKMMRKFPMKMMAMETATTTQWKNNARFPNNNDDPVPTPLSSAWSPPHTLVVCASRQETKHATNNDSDDGDASSSAFGSNCCSGGHRNGTGGVLEMATTVRTVPAGDMVQWIYAIGGDVSSVFCGKISELRKLPGNRNANGKWYLRNSTVSSDSN